jgi:formylmethanofuran dehydrogenase subunit E
MSEENKDMKPENKDAAKPAEAPKVETQKAEAPKVEAPKVEAPKKERPSNCAVCNKSIKKTRYYYRNGKYFCTQRCFKTTVKKAGEEAADKPAGTETK